MIRPHLRHAARIGNGDEGRQILVLRAQRVAHPRAHAGKAVERETGAHLVLGRAVRVRLGRHRVDEAQVVGQLRQVRQQIGDHLARLPARLEFPVRLHEVAVLALKGDELVPPGHRLAVALDQLRLVIPRVQMAQRAGAKDHQHILRLGREMRRARRVGMLRRPVRTNGRFVRAEQLLLGEQRKERDAAQAGAAVAEKIAAIQQPATGVREVASFLMA